MLTVLNIIGTRPEAIKMAPVIKELERHRDCVRSVVCVTAQHRQMQDQVLELFNIQPDYDLDIMKPNQSLCKLSAELFARLGPVIEEVKPDWVLAQGDTTTTMAASLVAFYQRVRFGHIEAGLRTKDKRHPFPEEINRRIADVAADAFFAPTECAREALLREGVKDCDIYITGNTVIDALQYIYQLPYEVSNGALAGIAAGMEMVLITAHRRESFGEPLRQICLAIRDLARHFAGQNMQFVYPVHLNPNVQVPVREILSGYSNVSLTEPLDYASLVYAMKRSKLILSDSGGIQEEAPSLKVPVLVMRDKTERPEGIEAGVARLVGTNRKRIVKEAIRILTDPQERSAMTKGINPYGDGRAAERIVSILLKKAKI